MNIVKQKEYNAAVVKKIADFKAFLNKIKTMSSGLKKYARSMVKAKINFYQEFGLFFLLTSF